MPINVTCPECHIQFLVGDEFAGRPGRCPECGFVLMVPGHDVEVSSGPSEDDPFDDFPRFSRRQREDDRRRHEDELREDFDDQRGGPGFDPIVRAEAWERVYKGLGLIQIAVILYFVSQITQTAFFLIRGIEQQNPNALPDSGEIAMGILGLVIMMVSTVFWMLGRFAGTKVPYVPARGWARVSFFMVLAGLGSVAGFCCLFIVGLGALAGGPNGGALAMLMLSFMILLLGMVLVAAAEMCGLVSLAKIGTALHNPSAASWARTSLILMFVLIGGLTMGLCGLSIYAAGQKQQNQQGQPGNGPFAKAAKGKGQKNAAAKDKDKEIAKDKDKEKDDDNQQANPNAQAQQPDPLDGGLDEKTQFISQMVMVGFIMLYLIHYSISLQKGRRAIRREIEVLTGHGDRQDQDHRDRY